MAEEKVIVPIELSVTDIKTGDIDLADVQKSMQSKLASIAKSAGDVLGNVDPSKLNKALTTSMDKVTNSYSRLSEAQTKFNDALKNAGSSSPEFRAKQKELTNSLENYERYYDEIADDLLKNKTLQRGLNKRDAGIPLTYNEKIAVDNFENVLDVIDRKIKSLKAEVSSLNPSDFINTATSGEMQKLISSYHNLFNAINKVESATKNWNQTAASNQMTDNYTKKLNELTNYEKKLESVRQKAQKMASVGATDKSWKNLRYDADLLDRKIREIIGDLQTMVETGEAFRFGNGDSQAELDNLSSRLENTSSAMNEIKGSSSGFAKNMSVILKAVSTFSNVASKGFHNVIGLLKKMNKTSQRTSKNMGKSLKKLWRDILMFGFGVRSTFFLIRRLRNVFIDSFKEMSKQIPKINTEISSFMTSLNQLKGSVGTAFQPLVSFVIPAINQLIASLNSAMVALGKFFATLTGQGYIYKFTAAQVDYAESLEGTAGAAKNAQKSLMGFDEINRLDGDDGGGAGAGDSTGKWETEMLDGMSSLAELIKKAWSESDFTEVGRYIGDKLLGALTTANDWLTSKGFAYAEKIGKSVATLINGVFDTLGLGDALGKTIANSLNMALIAIDTFLATTDWSDIGTFLYESLNSAIQNFNWDLLGKSVADLLMAAIDMWYTFASGFDFTALGTSLSTAINKMLSKLGEVDASGMSGWSKLGTALSDSITGILDMLIMAMESISWDEVGVAIGELIASIDWSGIVWDFTKLVASIVDGISIAFKNWAETDPISAGIAALLTSGFMALKVIPVIVKIIEYIPQITEFISKIGTLFTNIGEVATLVKGGATLKEAMVAVFGATATAVTGIISIVSGALVAIGSFISMLKDGFSWFKEILMIIGIALAVVGAIILGAATWPAIIVGAVVAVVATLVIVIKDNWQAICDFLAYTWEAFWVGFNVGWEWIKNAFTTSLEFIKNLWNTVWTVVKTFFVNLWNSIVQFVTDAINNIKQTITNVINAISTWWTNTWTTIKNTATNIWNGILNTINNIINSIKNIITTVINTIRMVWTNGWNAIKSVVTNVWNGIWGFIKNIINSIIGGINGMIRGIVNGINAVIGVLNNVSFDVPDWVPGMGGNKFGFNLSQVTAPQIPKLAQGGVIPPNKEFMAILGDQKNGTNIEAPLDTIKQAVAEELAEYIDAMMTGFQAVVDAVNEKDFDVKIGDNAIGKAAERYNKRQALVRGTS